MGACFLYGQSGGAGINFKVVGGTVQPQGKENLIWVNTSTPISIWVVSTFQPEWAFDGMVWIVNGTENGINILKKNAIGLYPSGCRMYRNGKWEDVESFLFRNGEWVRTAAKFYLVKDGYFQNGILSKWYENSHTGAFEEGYTYDGKICLKMPLTNGGDVTGTLYNFTIPQWAKTLHITMVFVEPWNSTKQYICYGNRVTVTQTVHRNEVLTIDVSNAAGKEAELILQGRGYSAHGEDIFGDIWFD